MQKLTNEDILPDHVHSITQQSYSSKEMIDGVKVVENTVFSAGDGTFEEMVRVDDSQMFEKFPDFSLKQVNRSVLLPQAIKAWHLHFNQEDIWYVPPQHFLMLGLWDIRKDSPTSGKNQKIVLGGGRARMVYIPRGVAHGAANFSHQPTTIIYFVNQHFNAEMPDEQRLPWDALGENFWEPEKE